MSEENKRTKRTLEQRKAELQKRLALVNSEINKKERKDERRIDALVGVAVRWVSHADPKAHSRLMKMLEEFYFDDLSRSFLGFELLSDEEKEKREEARRNERKSMRESTGEETDPVRINPESSATPTSEIHKSQSAEENQTIPEKRS